MKVIRIAIRLEKELRYTSFLCTFHGGNCCQNGGCCQKVN